MKNSTKGILFLLLLLNNSLFAQDSATVNSDKPSIVSADTTTLSTNKPEKIFIASPPTIGLGTGMFSFFGDVYTKHFQNPMTSRIASELIVSQAISKNFQLNFNVLFGTLAANERMAGSDGTRNVNFQSQIRAGSLNLQYNFGHFLPKNRTASPYMTVGVESFEFLSKTDAYDANGNKYYYWNDGTIRNIDQSAPNAGSAVLLKRDYTYESDIRQMNLDGAAKYSEYSFAIPIGMGAVFKINDFINFKIGTTMHFTFTDNIDGITFMSKGNRQGDTKYDKFMMTSCSIHYNFGQSKRAKDNIDNEDRYKNVDFLALDLDDYDKDGVPDPLDSCQCTPPAIIVDYKGCPLDDDKDNYPNYKDNEINSPPNSFVDIKGVQMSDSLIEDKYNRYIDSTMAYAEIVIRTHKGYGNTIDPNQKVYSVELGTFKKGLPADLMTQFLSVPDIESNNFEDSTTTYTAGSFKNLLDANFRKQQLIANGLTNLKIVYKQNGKYYDIPEFANHNNVKPENSLNKTSENIVVPPVVTKTTVDTVITKTKIVETPPVITKTTVDTVIAKAKIVEAPPVVAKTTVDTIIAKTKIDEAPPVITKTTVDTVIAKAKIVEAPPVVTKTEVEPVIAKTKIVEAPPIVTKTKVEPVVAQPITQSTKKSEVDSKVKYLNKQEELAEKFKVAETQPQPVVNKKATENSEENSKTTKIAATTKVNAPKTAANTNLSIPGVVLRVQLGAYKKPLSKKVFRGVNNLVEIKTEDGLYKYMSGSYSSFDDAAEHKTEMVLNGYPGAFITAYKDGKRISLKEAGATPVKKEDIFEASDDKPVNGVSKDLVRFKIQVGVFKNQPPDDKLAIYAKLKDVTGERTISGLTRYVVGSFRNYKEAEAYKNEIIKTYGISDPFVVALFNNEYISIPEALELMK